ncbi:MAG: energy transducer TonB [Thermodesulfobacteriota bacterium]
MRVFERNMENRRRLRRRRLKISLTAAVIFHLLLILIVGFMSYSLLVVPVADNESDLLLEITDYVPEEEESPDTPVKDPKAYSTKSRQSEKNEVKRGSFGTPLPSMIPRPATLPPSGGRNDEDTVADISISTRKPLSFNTDKQSVRRLIKEAARDNLQNIYTPDTRRPGNDGDHRGLSDINDFSVISPQDKYISYLQKFRNKVQNVWRPDYALRRSPAHRGITTVLSVEIRRDGEVENVEVAKSSGVFEFDTEAIRSVFDAGPYSAFPPSWEGQPTFKFKFGFQAIDKGPI